MRKIHYHPTRVSLFILVIITGLMAQACTLFQALSAPTTTPSPEASPTALPASPTSTPTDTQGETGGQPSPTASLPPTEAEEPTAEPTQPPTEPGPAMAEVTVNAFCRHGPGTVYPDLTAYPVGTVLAVDGKIADESWWRVQVPNSNLSCWISATLLELSGDVESVPVLTPPPTPTPLPPTATPTLTPSPTTPVLGTPQPPPANVAN